MKERSFPDDPCVLPCEATPMLYRAGYRAALLFSLLLGSSAARAADTARPKEEPKKAPPTAVKTEELTLEKLFPKRGLFGPAASGMAFSYDGKYAAYLYRPFKERRHGPDLWLLDVAAGKATARHRGGEDGQVSGFRPQGCRQEREGRSL